MLLFCVWMVAGAAFGQRRMEKLNRGIVAVRTSSSSTFISWRLLGTDPDNIGFNLYRDGVKINTTPLTATTNYNDANGTGTAYVVKPVINGLETAESNQTQVWANNYVDISLDVPADMTMPDGSTCSYSPNDCSVGDVDGDGEYEIFLKWDPSNAKDNSQAGYTGDVYIDCYKLNGTKLWRIDLGKNIRAGAHYTQFQVADFDGDGKAELACKTAPGTIDGLGNYLAKGPAASNTVAINSTDYRNSSGYILSGAEYLTVFSGGTGAELATASYNPARGTVSAWGDNYGNRVDRFLAATAYLDGIHPSIIMCRGYYTRAVVAAWDFKNGTLTNRWTYDSGTTSGVGAYGQGNHNLSVGDVDDDGKDEIIYGASAFDDNGSLLYRTGLGHGDAMHLTDLDPDRKGLEVWEVHEETGIAHNYEMHDAKTGEVIWGGPVSAADNGRGLAANILSGYRGFEMWSADGPGISTCKGVTVGSSPSMNFRIYWDGDLQDELLDGTSITKYNVGTLLSASDCGSNNGTKSTPCLSADILGDWREELILRTADNTKLRLYTTTTLTSNKLYTLMHDSHYRNSIGWQNTAYNQPPHCGFYVGDDMDAAPASGVYNNEKRWKTGTKWDLNTTQAWTDSLDNSAVFVDGDKVLFDLSAGANATISVSAVLRPSRMKINSPYNVSLSGTGTLDGEMDLKKLGAGILTLNNTNNFTGNTTVWDGTLVNNGSLNNSDVRTWSFSTLGGSGVFGANVTLGNNTVFAPGAMSGVPGKVVFKKNLTEAGTVTYIFDMQVSDGDVKANDTIAIGGNWTLSQRSFISLNVVGGTLPAGNYTLASCSGTVSGDLTKFTISGVPSGLSYSLVNESGNIVLKVQSPSQLLWMGTVDTKWDNSKTANWLKGTDAAMFASNDSVMFDDNTTVRTVTINETVQPSKTRIDATQAYAFSGTAGISGSGDLVKSGTGKLSVSNTNSYTGKTYFNAGTLEVSKLTNGGVASPLGAATNAAANWVFNGGKLSYTGITTTIDRAMTLNSYGGTLSVASSSTILSTGKLTGVGKLIKEGSGRLAIAVANDYKGGTVIKAGSVALTTDAANISGLGSGDTITFQGGSLVMYDSNTTANTSTWNLKVPTGYAGTLTTDGMSTIGGTLTGGGIFNYYTNYTGNVLTSNAAAYTGTMNITTDADGGYFCLYNTAGFPNARINLSNLVTMLYRVTSTVTIPIGELLGQANSVLGAGGTGACTVTWEVGNRNTNSTFNGTITNTQYSGTGAVGAIRKVGNGIWTLTNANTFTGGTVIAGGTIMVNNTTGSGLGTGPVSTSSGATLAGSGSIAGALTVTDGGVLAPGAGTGTFTVNNNVNVNSNAILAIDVDKTNATNDMLSLSGTLTMGGKLQINALNGTSFAEGDAFKIINGTVSGIPSEIIPASPGNGLEWDLSGFGTSGMLKVKIATALNEVALAGAVFPNPFKDHFVLRTDELLDDASVKVFNLVGETVFSGKYSGTNQISFNGLDWRSGVYLLRLQNRDRVLVQKIWKL